MSVVFFACDMRKGLRGSFFSFFNIDIQLTQFCLLKGHCFPLNHFEITSVENQLVICVDSSLVYMYYVISIEQQLINRNYSI